MQHAFCHALTSTVLAEEAGEDATVIDARPLGLRLVSQPPVAAAPIVPTTKSAYAELWRRLDARPAKAKRALEVALAPRSDSNLFVGFEGFVEGVFVSTYERAALGTKLEVTLLLPGAQRVVASARVEWIREDGCTDGAPGFGLRFERVEPADQTLLETFAARREPLFHAA